GIDDQSVRRRIATIRDWSVGRVLRTLESAHVLHPGPKSEERQPVGISLGRFPLQRVKTAAAPRGGLGPSPDGGVLRERHEGLRHGIPRVGRERGERYRNTRCGCSGRSWGLEQQIAERQVFLIDK